MAQLEGTAPEQTTFDELLHPLATTLQSIEDRRPHHHREVLTFTAFVRLLLYYFVKAPRSGRQLLTDTLSAATRLGLTPIKRSTFFDGFNRFPVEWFVQLLTVLLTSVAWQAIPELTALGKLYCVDGSLFPALAHMVWAEYQTHHPAVKLHLCFELNRMLAVQFLVDCGNSNEKNALRRMLEAGVTYIADRGYAGFQLLADIVAVQAHFVIRMKANLVYTVSENVTVELPASTQHLFTQVTDQWVRLTGAKGQPLYRLVNFWAGDTHFLILTDRRDLSTFQVILLYAYRWQVELIFRFLKRTLNGLHLLSTSPQGVTIHFYALLVAALLELRLKQLCVVCAEGTPAMATAAPAAPSAVPGLMVPPARLAAADAQTFLATVGEKLHRYWKISVHWLVTLRNLLAQPFDRRARHLLACT